MTRRWWAALMVCAFTVGLLTPPWTGPLLDLGGTP